MEMNFCRRCGAALKNSHDHVFVCEKGHTLYANASPAIGVFLVNAKNEVLLVERAIEPGLGLLDAPGGFCDGAEPLEDAIARELREEIHVEPQDYHDLTFLLSGIDNYPLAGETINPLSVIFMARVSNDLMVQVDDDATNAQFIPVKDVRVDQIYFTVVQDGMRALQRLLDK